MQWSFNGSFNKISDYHDLKFERVHYSMNFSWGSENVHDKNFNNHWIWKVWLIVLTIVNLKVSRIVKSIISGLSCLRYNTKNMNIFIDWNISDAYFFKTSGPIFIETS